jgi:pimeloyl-ACP methyl ester carboxylesterase
MGGHCLVQAAARRTHAFDRLVHVDPVILAPDFYGAGASTHARTGTPPEDMPVARRRAAWRDWQEMFERFRERDPFSRWQPRVLEDYCRHGVLPDGQGAFELACPPLVEASVYLGNTGTDVHDLLPVIRQPVLVMRARQTERTTEGRMEFSNSPTWPGLADALPNGRDLYLPELSHFIPMEDPQRVVAGVLDPDRVN